MSAFKEFTKGIIKENPTLVLVLGTCPTLATTTAASNAIGMGAAATFVLLGSNIVISLLRKVIPDKVRIPAFITIIAGFVTIVQMVVAAFLPSLDKALGIYIPLIVVNCIIIARAEMFASKNKVWPSIMDALGMGVGFTLALLTMGSVREILGNGTWFGHTVTADLFDPATIMILPPGGFLAFGTIIAVVNRLKKGKTKKNVSACASCPMQCANKEGAAE